MAESKEGLDQDKVQYKNIVTTNNSKLGLFTVTGAVIVLCSVGCEIGKQVSNYSINYYNGGRYPLPQTILVRIKITITTSRITSMARSGH